MEPSDEELLGLMPQQMRDDLATVARMAAHGAGPDVTPELFEGSLATGALQFARAVLARWGSTLTPVPPVAEEVGVLLRELRDAAFDLNGSDPAKAMLTRAADLLEQRHPEPVPVSERLPGREDCDTEGRCWWLLLEHECNAMWCHSPTLTHWLPATALPLPAVVVQP